MAPALENMYVPPPKKDGSQCMFPQSLKTFMPPQPKKDESPNACFPSRRKHICFPPRKMNLSMHAFHLQHNVPTMHV